MNVKFKYLSKETRKILQAAGVTEADLYEGSGTDLYVGANQLKTFQNIKASKKSATMFKPQEGSDMDHYPIGIEIPFALMDYKYKRKHSRV